MYMKDSQFKCVNHQKLASLGVLSTQTRLCGLEGGWGEQSWGEGITQKCCNCVLLTSYPNTACFWRFKLNWPSFCSTIFGRRVYRLIESSCVLICPHWKAHASKTVLLTFLQLSVRKDAVFHAIYSIEHPYITMNFFVPFFNLTGMHSSQNKKTILVRY